MVATQPLAGCTTLTFLNLPPLKHSLEVNARRLIEQKHCFQFTRQLEMQLVKGAPGREVRGALTSFRRLTCWVCRDIQDGLQQLHVLNVVNVNGLLQAHQQPL